MLILDSPVLDKNVLKLDSFRDGPDGRLSVQDPNIDHLNFCSKLKYDPINTHPASWIAGQFEGRPEHVA